MIYIVSVYRIKQKYCELTIIRGKQILVDFEYSTRIRNEEFNEYLSQYA